MKIIKMTFPSQSNSMSRRQNNGFFDHIFSGSGQSLVEAMFISALMFLMFLLLVGGGALIWERMVLEDTGGQLMRSLVWSRASTAADLEVLAREWLSRRGYDAVAEVTVRDLATVPQNEDHRRRKRVQVIELRFSRTFRRPFRSAACGPAAWGLVPVAKLNGVRVVPQ